MKNKIKFNLMAMFLFASLVMVGQDTPDGPEPPPTDPLPIDNILILLIVAGLYLGFYALTRKNKVENF